MKEKIGRKILKMVNPNPPKKIPLTQGRYTLVDACDYDYLMQWKWCYGKNCKRDYAIRTNRTSGKQSIYMHRVILEQMGFKNFAKSDHINRNGLNNCRCNLRPATNGQSNCNQGKRKDNTSGYTGVSWHKRDKKWQAHIQVNKKLMFLGYYKSKKEAALVYNKAAKKYHGKFAVLNEV